MHIQKLNITGIKDVVDIKPVEMVLSNIRIPIKDSDDVGLILAVYECEVPNRDDILLSDEHVAYEWVLPKEAAKRLKFKYPEELTSKVALL